MTAKVKPANRIPMFLPWIALTLVLLVSVWLRMRYLWVNGFSYDEGLWLMFGALANAGYTPYSVTFVGITPLALLTIQLGAKLFSTTTLAVRSPMMMLSLLGIVGIFLSFRPWRTALALSTGTLAAVFLSFVNGYFTGSASIMGEVPATSLAIVSFVLARQYIFDRQWFWLALSGGVFSLSLAFKLLVVFMPALVGVMILTSLLITRDTPWSKIGQQLIVSGGVWFLGALVPWIIFMMIYDPYAMYEQTFLFRLAFREVGIAGGLLPGNTEAVLKMLGNRLPLLLGGIVGVVVGWRKHRLTMWYWGVWFILSLLPLYWQSPTRQRYAVMMVPPLAALSAIAVVEGGQGFVQRLISNPRIRRFVMALIVLGIGAWFMAGTVQKAFSPPAPDTFPDLNLTAVQYVWQNTTADDCIITDDQRFAFAVNRLVPPALSETTAGRLIAGWLTTEVVIHQLELYNCPMVVYADWRFAKYLPELETRLRNLYFLAIPFEEDLVVYTAKKNVTRPPSISLKKQFGRNIIVEGIDLAPSPWQPEQEIRLATYWTTLQTPERSYKIFVQLRNNRNEPVANFDHFPFPVPAGNYRPVPHIDNIQHYSARDIAVYPTKGMMPTNAWPVGSTIREVITMKLPPAIPAGTYNLYIGIYDPDTQVRLPTQTEAGESNELLAAQIEIVEAR